MGIAHLDVLPLLYGLVIFIGLWSMWHKLMHGQLTALTVELTVFVLVFRLHGGTMAGGFAAAVAALLAGVVFPRGLRK